MNRWINIVLAIVSGLLFYIGWVPRPFFISIFVAFVPLLWVEHQLSYMPKRSNTRVWLHAYFAFLIWNVLVTWWVGNTTAPVSGVLANVLNALLMSVPFVLFHITKKRTNEWLGYMSLPAYWIAFEYLHLNWDLSWPWLTLGNSLAYYPQWIQWYEYTGVLGGSLWILGLNIMAFLMLRQVVFSAVRSRKIIIRQGIIFTLLLILPFGISYIIYQEVKNASSGDVYKNVVVVQPNIDPYNEKFDFSRLQEQMDKLFRLSDVLCDSTTDYLVWPETAFPQGIIENNIEEDKTTLQLRAFLEKYPHLNLVTGFSGYKRYDSAETETARTYSDGECCYDAFNSGMQLSSRGPIQIHHKSKLVPGVEKMPYPKIFGFLESLSIDMGGMSGSLGSQKHPGVFFSKDSVGVAPVICYESIYGEYLTEYVKRGANMIFIITNDGWWGHTDGHIQHLYYGALRAIETRRPVARSANTGISCFVNVLGEIEQAQPYWQESVIKQHLEAGFGETFYVRFGDYIGRLMLYLSALILFYLTYYRFKK
jgi:apolipoprotein N-acyltransferase